MYQLGRLVRFFPQYYMWSAYMDYKLSKYAKMLFFFLFRYVSMKEIVPIMLEDACVMSMELMTKQAWSDFTFV